MAAALFFAEAEADIHGEIRFTRLTREEDLEAQAKDIDAGILLLQAHIRGFLSRTRHIVSNAMRQSGNDRRSEHLTSPRTGERNVGIKHNSVQNLPVLGIGDNTDPGKDAQIVSSWNIEPRDTDAAGSLNPRISTKIPDIITLTPDELECKLEQAAKELAQIAHVPAAPWWIESPLELESRNLCTICSHVNFDVLLHTTGAYMLEPPIPLGDLQNISRKSECAFCRLLSHLASISLDRSVESLRDDTAVCGIDCHICDDPDWGRCVTRIRQICLRLTLPLPEQSRVQIYGSRQIGLRLTLPLPEKSRVHIYGRIQQILQTSEHPSEQKFNDVRLVNNQIDLDLIKSWIRVCEKEHGSTQLLSNIVRASILPIEPSDSHSRSTLITEPCQPAKFNETSFHLTVIDVREECLVDVFSEVRYVALSYVWGGPLTFQNVLKIRQSLYLPHGISLNDAAIPYTIRDAIRLVALLGEQYLWVDSLCICQDDMDNKLRQIGNMGNIYSRAMLTIVAAYGESANAGLLGVRPLSRNSIQHTELVQNILLANEILHLDDTLRQSHWNTRGWTYQENELSRRCLIFGENQVYFRCNRKEFKEDSGFRDVARGLSRAFRIRGEKHPIWNSYRRAVASYTKLAFSFETDVIHAFQGVISLLQPAFKGDFLFGLPETELDVALLWQPYSPIRRRINDITGLPAFPSWSWAGWVGRIRYPKLMHVLDDVSRVEWQYTDRVQGQIGFWSSDELRAPKSGRHSTWEYVDPLSHGTPYYYQPEKPDLWCLHPVAEKEERRDRILIQPSCHFLTFKAYVAMFSISTSYGEYSLDPLASCTIDTHILSPVSILDNDGFTAGTIYLPGHESPIMSSQKYEIVCLSRRRADFGSIYGDNVRGCHPPTLEDDFKSTPGHITIYPVRAQIEYTRMVYDPRRYNMGKPWPLYNVMLIRRENDIAYRVAIGLMHVTAFLQAQPVKKLITLA